ncbi:hypothetical protein H0V99_00810 [Candidatus Saccharibacteria bacterium]|nr:hypothetical protein [Candidatus Saccharibacteria bacterium]
MSKNIKKLSEPLNSNQVVYDHGHELALQANKAFDRRTKVAKRLTQLELISYAPAAMLVKVELEKAQADADFEVFDNAAGLLLNPPDYVIRKGQLTIPK